MAKMGCLVMLVSFAILGLVVVLPVLPFARNNASVDEFLRPLICQPGEAIQRQQYQTYDSEGTSYSMKVYCIGKDERKRDESGRWFLLGILGFGVPFTIGLIGLIGGASRSARKQAAQAAANMQQGLGWQSSPSPISVSASTSSTLAERLKQIEDARNNDLITPEEYDRLRKNILDESL